MRCSEHSVALVLAAGYSHRYGELDKRRVVLPSGQTLVRTCVDQIAGQFSHFYVLLREDDDIEALGLEPNTPCIRTKLAAKGQGSSLADGFRFLLHACLPDTIFSAAVFLADMPSIQSTTVDALLKNISSNSIHRPVYLDKPGHPVVFGRDFWPALSQLGGDVAGKQILDAHRDAVNFIEINDIGVIQDIDTPEDLSLIHTHGPQSL